MMDFIKNNMLVVGIVVVLIIAAAFFMMRKTSTKDGKVKSKFTMFKKRLDDSKKSSALATAVMNTEEVNTLFTQIGNDICGKPFDAAKVEPLLQNNEESSAKLNNYFGTSDLRMGMKLNEVLVIAIIKSTLSEDKKIDYIATLLLDVLLKSNVPIIEYNKEKGEVKMLSNPFRDFKIYPSAEIISFQEFGTMCHKFMIINLDPVQYKELIQQQNRPQESKDELINSNKKLFDAITIEKVCALLS
jgi:hypothetical protein